MVCNKCGNELKEGAKFCDKCGKKIKSNNGDKKGNKLPFMIISIVVVIAVVVGLIFMNKNNNSENINIPEQSKMSASKELVREDDTAPRGVTYNFKLEDVKNAMDKACKDNNTDNYLDFEYLLSQNGVDFYQSYKDETGNYGCLIKVMVYNDYVMSISFIYYDDMIEELSSGGYNVFFNILKDNYSEDYANKIKSILENLENEKYEYYENTICYKEIQDNFGTTEYSITASTFDSYNELEGVSSTTSKNETVNQIDKDKFLDSITEEDKKVIYNYVKSVLNVSDDKNFIDEKDEIIENEMIYMYLNMKYTGSYNLYANYYSVLPISNIPSNWKDLSYNELGNYLKVYNLSRADKIDLNSQGGVTDEQLSDAKSKLDVKINEQLQKLKELKQNSTSKELLKTISKLYADYIIQNNSEAKQIITDGFKESTRKYENESSTTETIEDKPSYYCQILSDTKVLYVKYYTKFNNSSSYQEKGYNEYISVAVVLDVDSKNIPLAYYTNSSFNGISFIKDLIDLNCIPNVSDSTYVITPKITVTHGESTAEQVLLEELDYIRNYFGI